MKTHESGGAVRSLEMLTGTAMRVAQIAPLVESVPPKLYGGTERGVAWLVDELVSLVHEVPLFATGDSARAGSCIRSGPVRSASPGPPPIPRRHPPLCLRRSR